MLAQLILSIWILTAGVHAALLFIAWRANSYKSFPWFTAFLVATFGQNIGALLAWRLPPATYSLAYYASAFVILCILSGVAIELFFSVYGGRSWRPPVVTRRLWRLLALAYPLCILLGVLLHARTKYSMLNSARTAEQIILSGLVATFWILARYSWRWGVTWRKHAAGIIGGMVLCLTVDLVGIFISGLGGRTAAEIATIVWQCSYLGSLFIWFKCFSSPENKIVLSPQLKAKVRLAYGKVARQAQASIVTPRKSAHA